MKRLKAAVQSGRRRARSLAARPPAADAHAEEPLLAPPPPPERAPGSRRTLTRTQARRELPQDLAPHARKERAIAHELIEVQDAMRANLDAVVARGEAVELADTTTFAVAERAADFRGQATALRKVQFWRKWRVCIVLSVLVVLAALAAAGCGIAYAVCGGTIDPARCRRTAAAAPTPAPTPAPEPATLLGS